MSAAFSVIAYPGAVCVHRSRSLAGESFACRGAVRLPGVVESTAGGGFLPFYLPRVTILPRITPFELEGWRLHLCTTHVATANTALSRQNGGERGHFSTRTERNSMSYHSRMLSLALVFSAAAMMIPQHAVAQCSGGRGSGGRGSGGSATWLGRTWWQHQFGNDRWRADVQRLNRLGQYVGVPACVDAAASTDVCDATTAAATCDATATDAADGRRRLCPPARHSSDEAGKSRSETRKAGGANCGGGRSS